MDQPDHNRAKIILVIAIIALIVAAIFAYRDFVDNQQFRIIFFDVGQGDSALIRLPSGAKMLIDCGPDKSVLYKLGKYLNFFDRSIDYLVVSHPDRDHYGGCIDVLKRYKVKNIIENGDTDESGDYWPVWQEAADDEKANRKIIDSEYHLTDGDAELHFLQPSTDLNILKKDNNQSMLIKLLYASTSVLFTGDIEAEREEELVRLCCGEIGASQSCPNLQADFLKVPHHGSLGSLVEDFYSAVSPQKAVFSVGKNSYGHPSLRVIKNLERVGAEIWRTDHSGDLIIR